MPRTEWSFFLAAEDHKQVKVLMAFAHSRLTPWGQAILAAAWFGTGIASVGTQIAAYFLPSFILALFMTAGILTLFFKPTVSARRRLSPTTAGGTFVYQVIVQNTGKRILRNLGVFESTLPYGLYTETRHKEYLNSVPWLKPGEQAVLRLVFRVPRRGIFDLAPLLVCSDFPSGILRSTQKSGGKAKFVVYPRLILPPDMNLGKGRRYQRGGLFESTKVGDSNEFSSTREYRPGDRLKDIHWASTARAGQLIVKEYVEEYFVRVGIYIDAELKRFEKHRAFETRISLCAGLCQAMIRRDYVVDLFLSAKSHHMQSGRGLQNFDQILEFLAAIEGDTTVDFNQGLRHLKEYARELSELIVLLKDWDLERSRFVQSLKETGLRVKPIVIRDKKTTIPVEDASVVVYTTKELIKSQ